MTQLSPLDAEKNHLSGLLEAIQRCVYFLDASSQTLLWPMTGAHLAQNKKDKELFQALAAINERFAKLQDTLGAAMRHSLVLSGERSDMFPVGRAFTVRQPSFREATFSRGGGAAKMSDLEAPTYED
jgi:hypothetical protein